MTITFIESRYPKKLIDFLVNVRKYAVEKTAPGIYYIKGDVFLMQIINNRRLSDSENLWLKNLRDNLNNSEAEKVTAGINLVDKNAIKAYIDVVYRANLDIFMEVMKMGDYFYIDEKKFIVELLTKTDIGRLWLAERKAEARTKGITEGLTKGRAEGITQGLTKGRAEGIAKGLTKGISKGLTKGETKAKISIAKKLKSGGMSDKLISKYTGLPLSKVKNLKVPKKLPK